MDRATVAGILLCAPSPQEWLLQATIMATCYRGLDRASDQLDAQEITGPLPVQIADAVRFVVRNMRVSARKHPEREDISRYSHVDIGPGLEWRVVLDGRSPQCPRSCCHAIVAFRLTHP